MFDLGPDLPNDTLVEMVRLPTRIRNAVKFAGLKTIGDLRETTDEKTIASQIWNRGRSNGCAHNLVNDGEKRGLNDTSHRLERLFLAVRQSSPSPCRLSIQFKANCS